MTDSSDSPVGRRSTLNDRVTGTPAVSTMNCTSANSAACGPRSVSDSSGRGIVESVLVKRARRSTWNSNHAGAGPVGGVGGQLSMGAMERRSSEKRSGVNDIGILV